MVLINDLGWQRYISEVKFVYMYVYEKVLLNLQNIHMYLYNDINFPRKYITIILHAYFYVHYKLFLKENQGT